MRTEKQNIERMILDNLIESLINEDFWNLCIELDHNPGDTFQITDILVYYLTKKSVFLQRRCEIPHVNSTDAFLNGFLTFT